MLASLALPRELVAELIVKGSMSISNSDEKPL